MGKRKMGLQIPFTFEKIIGDMSSLSPHTRKIEYIISLSVYQETFRT